MTKVDQVSHRMGGGAWAQREEGEGFGGKEEELGFKREQVEARGRAL